MAGTTDAPGMLTLFKCLSDHFFLLETVDFIKEKKKYNSA